MQKVRGLHHRKKLQGLGKHEKVQIADQKLKLLIWVGEVMHHREKEHHQHPLKQRVFQIATTKNPVPTILYHL